MKHNTNAITALNAAALLLVTVLWSGCATVTKVPDGLAELPSMPGSFRAISPEGLRYEVYERSNDPKQTLDFWNDSYDYRMRESGYTSLRDPIKLESGIGEVVLHEWVLTWRGQEYVYAHVLGLKGDRIVVVEIGGERAVYEVYREAITAAIKTLGKP